MEPIAPPSLFERIMATLPGWMLLLGGAAMVAMITLVPPWLECRRLDWQSQVMAIQSKQLASQQVAYEQFLTALREDDPIVIERMAYYHLRLKPVGTATLDELNQLQATQAAVYNQLADHANSDQNNAKALPLNKVWSTLPTIEDLLAKPMYRPSQFCPAGVVPDTRMVRLVTGPARHIMLGLGVLCLFFGLLPVSAGALMTVRPVTDELDESYDELDAYAEQDGEDAFLATLDDAAPHVTDDLYPDASETAWALAGTGAVSVSAARSTFGDEHDVLVAELDEQDGHADLDEADGDLVQATLEEDDEQEVDEADEELDETESDEDEDDTDDSEEDEESEGENVDGEDEDGEDDDDEEG